ncbi:ABC transporter substrate-binding protein [Propionibacteriaceae bacterium Y1923]
MNPVHLWRRAVALLAGLLALTLVAGCGTSSTSDTTTAAGTGSAATTAPETRTVTDMADREVTLPGEVTSIGTIGSVGVLNAFVQLMGGADKIVNELPARFQSPQWAMQYEFSPQIKGGPLFEEADEIVIENILTAKPDVIFTMTKDTASLLEERGIAVVYLEWKDTEDVKEAVTLVGEVLGEQELAAKYLTYFDATKDKAAALVADLPQDQRTTVLYGDPVGFSQPHVIAEWWIAQAGGVSVTAEASSGESLKYTMEDLLAWNPQVMILTNAKLIDEIKANSSYANITAVKDDNIHVIPTVAHVWGNRTVEQPLTVLWTLHQLYPDRLSAEDLGAEIKTFYKDFFGYEMSDEQVAKIIES